MLRTWPLLAASLLLGALALACADDAGQPSTPTPSPVLAPTPMTFPERPEITISPDKKYFANVETTKGTFRIKLRPDIAIQTVNSFIFLAREGFYDGVAFHRVIPGFVAQGGDPTGTGSGGPGYTLPAEFSDVPFERGTVGLARSNDPDSGSSQFFIAYAADVYDDLDDSGDASPGDVRLRDVGPLPAGSTVARGDPDIGSGLTTVSGLNGLYTVFGKVIEGMEVVDSLTARDPSNIATPQPPGDTIIAIVIEEE
jgi:peptidylprolyl isomerase